MKSRVFIQVLSLLALGAMYVSIVGADGDGCGTQPECVDTCVTGEEGCCSLGRRSRNTGTCVADGDVVACVPR